MNVNIDNVMRKYQPASKLMIKTVTGFKEESCFDSPFVIPDEINYNTIPLDHVVDCSFFRKNFVGSEYETFVGTLETYGPVIITMKKGEPDKGDNTPYIIIFRTKDLNFSQRIETYFSSQVKKSFLNRKPSQKQIMQLLDKDVNFSKLKLVIPDSKLDSRILSIDESKHRTKYKVGVVLAKPGQSTDNEYFNNSIDN